MRRKQPSRDAGRRWRVGVIADTHGVVRPEALAALAGVDRIIHAGDIGAREVLDALSAIAPLTAVRGNNDRDAWADTIPGTAQIEVGRASIYVIHDRKALDLDPASAGISAVVSGHSHQPRIVEEHGVLFVNPGSAGPRRFRLPISLALLTVDQGRLRAELVPL